MSVRHPPFPLAGPGGEMVGGIDWLGNEFKIGEPVMYCVTAGRGQMMAIGRVVAVELVELSNWSSAPVEELRVRVLTLRTSGHWNAGARTRPAWVNAMNITALPRIGTFFSAVES